MISDSSSSYEKRSIISRSSCSDIQYSDCLNIRRKPISKVRYTNREQRMFENMRQVEMIHRKLEEKKRALKKEKQQKAQLIFMLSQMLKKESQNQGI